MSVREGYKQTEIGVIPEDWEAKTFGNILTVKYGKNQKQVEDSNGLYPILGTGGLMGYANRFLYDKPSVLIGRKGTIDKPQYMDTPFWTVDTLFYTEINADIDPKWLFQKFKTIDWKKHNEASGVPSLSVSNIQRIVVSVPPLPEQQKIAEILSTVDQKIDSIASKIEETQTLKQGLMQRLLSEGIGHSEFKESEIGRIPLGWEVKSLEKACKRICVGFVGTCEKYYTDKNNGVPMIRTGNLQNEKLLLDNLKYVSFEFHESNKKSQLHGSDLLIARHGNSGQCVIVPNDISSANCLNIVIVRTDPIQCIPKFVMYYFNSNVVQMQMKNKKAGSTQSVINTKEIANTIVAFPPLEEQKQIAEILSTTDEKLESLRAKKEAFVTLKKGLMQKLLSGEVRVN